MVDIHTHLLFNTDDGVENIEEAIEKIISAKKRGIDTICVTPHYIEPEYTKTKIQNRRKLDKIKMELKKREVEIKLYLGNEIYISEEINENLKNNIINTVGNTKYVLIELPRNKEIKNLKILLKNIINSGNKVIIAHPERYLYVQKNIKYFDEMIKEGKIYLQGNYGSILGVYGVETQKTIIKLIKEKKLNVLASDIHRNNIYENIPELLDKLKKITDKKYINELIDEIPRKIINNENISEQEINKSKFRMLQFFKK